MSASSTIEGIPVLPGAPSDAALALFRGIAEELRPSRNLEVADRIRKDPFWFSREVLGNRVVFPETLDGDWGRLFNFIFSVGKAWQYGIVNAPRGSYKTTIIASLVVWLIALDRNIRILYITNVYPMSILFAKGVRSQLDSNEVLTGAFGTFKPKQIAGDEYAAWRDDYFFVSGRTTMAKEPTFTASSVGITKVGGHYDVIIVDDGVDKENTKTEDGIRSTIEWFKLQPPLLDHKSKYGPGGCLLNDGTRYSDGDLHGWILGEVDDGASPKDLFQPLVLRALERVEWDEKTKQLTNPVLKFPTILTKKRLEDLYKLEGSYWFYSQYQNECVPPEWAHFKRSQFKLVPFYSVPTDRRVHIFTDYASGLEEKNDRTALWVVALDWERKAYALDFEVGRWSLDERVYRTIMLAQHYDAQKVSIELVQGNEGVLANLRHARDARRLTFHIEEIGGRSTESKKLRVISLQPRFENGEIFFVERNETMRVGILPQYIRLDSNGVPTGEIVDEFVRFPKAVHDDIPDALSDIDKLDKQRKTYLFAGASTLRRNPTQPELVNGRLVSAPPMRPVGRDDFWRDSATRLRMGRRTWADLRNQR